MWPNPQETTHLVTFTEAILNEKLHFFHSVSIMPFLQSTILQNKFTLIIIIVIIINSRSFIVQNTESSSNFCCGDLAETCNFYKVSAEIVSFHKISIPGEITVFYAVPVTYCKYQTFSQNEGTHSQIFSDMKRRDLRTILNLNIQVSLIEIVFLWWSVRLYLNKQVWVEARRH